MKKLAFKVRDMALLYLKWGWPLVLLDAGLEMWVGRPHHAFLFASS